jgi:cyclin-dependent kinase 8/11
MALCSELSHPQVIHLVEIILEDKCIFMVFEYAEHDLLQIIHHHHSAPQRHPIPPLTIKSILYQLLNGLLYLHSNWVLHRDLKPANIMVTSGGEVKIGDLGLARLFSKPLHSLFSGDKVVVTIWYRAPELLLGSRHYTPAVDLWAVGCIFAELLSLRPIFKGEEAKMDAKKTVPFQRHQMQKIVDVLGMPNSQRWPGIQAMPEYSQLQTLAQPPSQSRGQNQRSGGDNGGGAQSGSGGLEPWYTGILSQNKQYPPTESANHGFALLASLLEYDPAKRLTARQALTHPYFMEGERFSGNCFEGAGGEGGEKGKKIEYPHRRVSQDDNDIRTSSLPGTKRSGLPDDSMGPRKKMREN